MGEKIGFITVEGKPFSCFEAYGFEYGDRQRGFPIQPYRYERIIDDTRAYLVDGAGIVWILEHQIINSIDYGLCFDRPCLRWCLTYIQYYDPIFSGRLPSEIFDAIGVEDARVNIYNAMHIGIIKPATSFDDMIMIDE